MAILSKGTTYSDGDQVTSTNLNALVDSATFASDAVDDSTTQLSSGTIIVKDLGISAGKLATSAVTTAKIAGSNVTTAKIAAANITTSLIADSNVTKAKIENLADYKVLGNVSGGAAAPAEVAILDEDNMSSNSATSLATQQSIKAYVDTKLTAEDLDFAGDSGSSSVDLDSQTFTIAGATGLDTAASGQTLTVSLDLNELATETSIAQDDFVAMVDNTDSGNGKITFSNLEDQVFGSVSGAVAIAAGGAAVLGSFTSLQLKNALSNETGSGAAVFATSPTLVTPALGTPASGVMTNATGTAASLTSGNVTTNANLTGHVTSVGNAAVLGSFTSAQLKTALTNETGSGAAVFGTSPTLVTPALGTPASGVMTNATGTAANLTVGATTGVEAGADVTDATNVTAAGALMDSELTSIADVKALNQSVVSGATPTFTGTNISGTAASLTVGATTGVEAGADVTDATNVTAAGALMDSEVTNLAQVKAFDASDYATSSQGTLAAAALPKTGGAMTGAITTNSTFDGVDIATRDGVLTSTTATAAAALPKAGGAMTGAITTNSTFDGRDVATDGTKLDGVEASADVTDATNVTAAGALMDSELTSIANVKALNQSVVSGAAPTFAGTNVTGTASLNINGTVGASSTTTAKVTTLTASTGVLFGSDTAAANTLDDYEEGTWTPVIRGSSTPGTYEISQHYSSYTKVGRLVTLSCKITLAASITAGGSGYTKLTGAPFPKVANTAPNAICATKGVDYAGSFITVEFDSPNATSNLYLTETLDNGGGVDLPIANLAAYDVFVFTISYEV